MGRFRGFSIRRHGVLSWSSFLNQHEDLIDPSSLQNNTKKDVDTDASIRAFIAALGLSREHLSAPEAHHEEPTGKAPPPTMDVEDAESTLQALSGPTGIQILGRGVRKKRLQPKRELSPPTAPIRRGPTVVCKYYMESACSKGKDCTFAHVGVPRCLPEQAKASSEICRFHILGSCLKGSRCPYSHDLKRVPCRFFHLWNECSARSAEACRFSHDAIDEATRDRLRREATKTK